MKTWKSRKSYKNAIILKYENVASKTNSNWFTDIVQIAFYPTCLFRENKNVTLFYFLPLSLKLTKPCAPIFVTFSVFYYNFEHLKLWKTMLLWQITRNIFRNNSVMQYPYNKFSLYSSNSLKQFFENLNLAILSAQ